MVDGHLFKSSNLYSAVGPVLTTCRKRERHRPEIGVVNIYSPLGVPDKKWMDQDEEEVKY